MLNNNEEKEKLLKLKKHVNINETRVNLNEMNETRDKLKMMGLISLQLSYFLQK